MKKLLLLILLCASMALAVTTSPAKKVSKPDIAKGYEYGTATVYYNGLFYRFFCSYGLDSDPFIQHPDKNSLKKSWDYIRMRTSRDGATWSAARVVLVPTVSNNDSCACDPAIIRDGGYWYLYYTGFKKPYNTVTFVARSKNIEGPYEERYVGGNQWKKYPPNPEPVFRTVDAVYGSSATLAYGAGQASVVKTDDGKFHFWFTDVSYAPDSLVSQNKKLWKFVHVVSSSPYKNLQNQTRTEISLDGQTRFPMNDFGDVKWNPKNKVFEMWMTSVHYSLAYFSENQNIYLKRYTSKDGIKWTSSDTKGPFHLVSNVGLSGDSIGWINHSGKYLVSFAGSDESLNFSSTALNNMWAAVNTLQDESVPGLPWSTYQFSVGVNRVKKISIPDSNVSVDGKNMRYYQFPDSLKKRNLEFIAGDFDGDGVTDIGAVDRNSNQWFIRSSLTGEYGISGGNSEIKWGWQWNIMKKSYSIVLGDFDGDGKTDRAVVDVANKKWWILSSKTGKKLVDGGNAGLSVAKMTHPLTGDYDGDGKSDKGAVSCYDNDATPHCSWKYVSSLTGKEKAVNIPGNPVGDWLGMSSAHIVLEGDYDGDGKTDPTIWDASQGWWFTISSRTGAVLTDNRGAIFGYQWGGSTYKPVVGDFNGDGISDRSMVLLDDPKKFRWFVDIAVNHNPSHFGFVLDFFKKFKNDTGNFAKDTSGYKILVGDYDGDAISDCIIADKEKARVYFYTSLYGNQAFEKKVYPLYNPSTGALYKVQFVPEPSIDEPKIHSMPKTSPKFSTKGMTLTISDMELGSDVRVYNTIGQNIIKTKADFGEKIIQLPSKGMYIVRVGSHSSVVNIK